MSVRIDKLVNYVGIILGWILYIGGTIGTGIFGVGYVICLAEMRDLMQTNSVWTFVAMGLCLCGNIFAIMIGRKLINYFIEYFIEV